MADSRLMVQRGARPQGRRRQVRVVALALIALGAATPAAAAATPTPAPATTVAPAAVAPPLSQVTVPGAATPVPVPGIPPVDPQYTDGADPNLLLARSISLSSVGASQAPLQANLATAQQALDAASVEAAQASAAEAKAKTAADVAGAAAADASREAASLQRALSEATLNLYTGGSATQALATSPANVDQLSAASAYEATLLSPDGILASKKAVARAASDALAARSADLAVAASASGKAAAAVATAAAETAHIKAELAALESQTATLVADEHTALSTQAGQALTGPGALEFTPAGPLPAPLPTTSVALAWAFSELGTPYLWGGTGPDMFDCSGLMQYAWGKAGVTLPRVSEDQYTATVPVPLSSLLPGDLVFFGSSDIHHVAMYIGDGLMLSDDHTGTFVKIEPMWWTDLAGFGRVASSGTPVPVRATTPARGPAVVPTAGAEPSETEPPPGYVAPPGASGAPVATTTTTAPPPGASTTSTTAPPSTTAPSSTAPSTTAPSTTLVPAVTSPPTTASGPSTTSAAQPAQASKSGPTGAVGAAAPPAGG